MEGMGDERLDEVKELLIGRGLSEREGMVLAVDERLRVGWCLDRRRWNV